VKIGVLTEGDGLNSLVAEDFGRAPFFLIVDGDTLDYQVIENEFANGDGPGYKVAKAIADLKPDHVICGGIGTHGLKILEDAGIRVWYDYDDTAENCIGTVKDRLALEKKFEGKQRRGLRPPSCPPI